MKNKFLALTSSDITNGAAMSKAMSETYDQKREFLDDMIYHFEEVEKLKPDSNIH